MKRSSSKSTSARSMRKHKKSRAVESVKKSLFQSQHFTIKISLHVKSTSKKAKPSTLEEGDILQIISGIRDKAIEIDTNDDISL